MELRQLVYFEAVARLGGFTRAAEQLHVAQPAISAQVRRLERELGAALFERTTRRVRLTEAGTLLLARARTVLTELDGARDDLGKLAAVLGGHLVLGVTPMLGPVDLTGLLAGFHRRYPGVTLAVRSGLVVELLAELDVGTVDALVAPIHDDLPARYLARPMGEERLILATPPERLPPGSRTVSLSDVRDEPFVCLPARSGLRAILTAAAAGHGFSPNIQFEAADPVGIRRFVAAGLGVALLAESAAYGDGPSIDVHRLAPEPSHPPIGLFCSRREPAPTMQAWVQHLQSALAIDRLADTGPH